MIERYQGTIETEYKKKIFLKHRTMRAITILVVFLCVWFAASPSYALATSDRVDSTTRNQISGNADDDDNTLDLNITSNAGSVTLESTLQILILLTILSLAPSILIMLTSFTRILLSFIFENSNWNADNATKSDIDRFGIIYYICSNESGV